LANRIYVKDSKVKIETGLIMKLRKVSRGLEGEFVGIQIIRFYTF